MDKKNISSQCFGVLCRIRGWGGVNWHTLIQRAWCSSLQTCSDRLHMPGNLEFIRPPFLISVSVIQINSNEISRGKAPFGWGVCSSPQLSPMVFSLSEGQIPHSLTSAYGRMNLRCCHSQTQSRSRKEPRLFSRLEGIRCEFMNHKPILVRAMGT